MTDYQDKDCTKCKERYMCDRVKYDCPRDDAPTEKDVDELTIKQIKIWEDLYNG